MMDCCKKKDDGETEGQLGIVFKCIDCKKTDFLSI